MSYSLNADQQSAVTHKEGPCMVLAGPGAGKTRVITARILHLLTHDIVGPYQFLALTFTKKAAKEMRRRLAEQLGESMTKRLWIGTFHRIFGRILRIESGHLGISSNFTIYDQEESKGLLLSIIKELGLDPKVYAPDAVLWRISQAKKRGLDADEYAKKEVLTTEDKAYKRPYYFSALCSALSEGGGA